MKKPPKDPNYKTVSHDIVYIDEERHDLIYYIDFQNIEGDDVSNIIIEDFFDFEYLEKNNVKIISSSHPCEKKWVEDKLLFIFDDIKLPSAKTLEGNSNVDESKGFVTYSASIKEPYIAETIISNKANIKFYHHLKGDIPIEVIPTNKVTTKIKYYKCIYSEKIINKITLILSVIILLLIICIIKLRMT
ncbi:MAG: hypothetical protein R3E32_12720 [Chitinophagales bacterium]